MQKGNELFYPHLIDFRWDLIVTHKATKFRFSKFKIVLFNSTRGRNFNNELIEIPNSQMELMGTKNKGKGDERKGAIVRKTEISFKGIMLLGESYIHMNSCSFVRQ